MQIRVLGDLEVVVAGRPADLGGRKPRALLAQLVAAEGRPVTVDYLVDQVWGEDSPARVEASLHSYVARLRRALLPAHADPSQQPLRTLGSGYALQVPTDDIDACRFGNLVTTAARCAQTDAGVAVETLAEALGLWRGEAYAGFGSPSLRAEATRLEELRVGALTDLWQLRIERGEHAMAIPALEPLVQAHPLREQLWRLLALALYRAARQGDALAALRRAREHLAEELGVDPGVGLRQLEEAILRQDPTLDTFPTRVHTTATAGEVAGPVDATARPSSARPDQRPRTMFGRAGALLRAVEVLERAAAGRGRTVVVSGEPGIGKTRFTEALLAEAEDRGFRVGRGGWEPEASPPLWGWTRAVAQVLGDGAVLATEEVADAASTSFRQAESLLAALGKGPPSLIVLDDVHWADGESLRLLRRVATQLDGQPAVLVVATRNAPAEIGAPVAEVLAALARLDPLRVDLTGLDADAVAEWVGGQAGLTLPPDVATEMVNRTDGNPFFVTELVRLLLSDGALTHPSADAWRSVPSGVTDVVRQRLSRLDDDIVDLLTTAAVAGRSFDVAVLAEVAGDHATAEVALEAAQVIGLVDHEGPGRFRFTHALVRDAVREATTATVRARKHAAVATAIERVHSGRIADHAAELAEHYRQAGPAHTRSAWVFARKAAERAAASAAHDEALRLLADAERLQLQDPLLEPVELEDVLLRQVRALTRLGHPVDAWAPASRAARSALERADPVAAATSLLAVTEGQVWGWRIHPNWDPDAIELWETVLAAQPGGDPLTEAHLRAALAVENLHCPDAGKQATTYADQAIGLARRTGSAGHRHLEILRLACHAFTRPDRLHHRIPIYDEIVALATRLDDSTTLASALAIRAQDRAELRRLDRSYSDVLRAREIAERQSLPQNLVVTGWCLAVRAQLEEDWDAAERMVDEVEALQATLAMSGHGIGLTQRAMIRDMQGRLPELEPALRDARAYHPLFRELHALALVRGDEAAEARLRLGEWADQPALPMDYLWLPLTAIRAEVWSALGDEAAARDLSAALTPYADRLAISVPVTCRGSVHLWLGELGRVLGDGAAARTHLAEARRVHEELGLPVWVRRTDEALGRLESRAGT